jgi:flagellar assembly protein FliH
MALIKNTAQRSAMANAVILDLGDLARQGERIKQHAQDRADEIIERAHKERQRIMAGAEEAGQEKGFERGFEEGKAKGCEEGRAKAEEDAKASIDAVVDRWTRAIDAFEATREQMLLEAKHEVVAFAGVVAQRVTKRVVELDDRVVAEQLEAVLQRVSAPSRLVVAISPADEAAAQETLPALVDRLSHVSHADLVVDPALAAGSCVVRTSAGGEIDASIDAQIERVLSVLLPCNGSEPTL